MNNAIIGPALSGKSAVFDLLTAGAVAASPGQNRIGNIKVPDPRLLKLSQLYQPKKTTQAEITFLDFGRLGAGKKIFSLNADDFHLLKTCPTLSLVLGAYEKGLAESFADFSALLQDLILEDLMVADARLERLRKEGEKGEETRLFERVKELLEQDMLLRADAQLLSRQDLRNYSFLTLKPLLILLNLAEEELGQVDLGPYETLAQKYGFALLPFCATLELEISRLSSDEQPTFLQSVGLSAPLPERFLGTLFTLLDYITFYTVSKPEVRSWKLRRGTKAKLAAGKIHTDIERGFIRAEVMRSEDLLRLGSEAAVKTAGKFRVEGKDYIVQDGDIFHVRFNV